MLKLNMNEKRIKEAKERLENFLKENPHMKDFQLTLTKELDALSDDPNVRLHLLNKMIKASFDRLTTSMMELNEPLKKVLSSNPLYKKIISNVAEKMNEKSNIPKKDTEDLMH